MSERCTFPWPRLHEFCAGVLRHLGVPEAEARLAADVLSAADRRGIDSHGVARLRTYYDLLSVGRINPRPRPRIVRETPSTATVDGDNGLGLVVGPWANQVAMDKAAAAGTGWVSVCHTNHYGIAGYYVMKAAERDMIGWSMTNTTRGVAPLWGAERMLGTNPIAIGVPAGEEPPFVLDMATCTVAYGKIEMAEREGSPIPLGWAIDADGYPTTDPRKMIEGGALTPLGSEREHGGHKGYGLAVAVDVLTAVLSGANWGPFAPPFALRQSDPPRWVGKGIGHFFGAMRIDAFRDPDEFKAHMDDFLRTLRATRPAPGTSGPLVAGDPERAAQAERDVHGVPVVAAVLDDLRDIARRTGVPLD
ncbi:MAG TPA: Ldh family oxidoreductase [Vicinamibacteria bacterium]|nr:Ldh family oxidoreductase [Vicinamibacteria bacterium]